MNKKEKILIVDIETTGFLKDNGLILEVGIVELDLTTGNRKIIYNELVKEDGLQDSHKTSWVFDNSDLKFEDAINADPLDIATLQKIFDNYQATAYNKKFDFDFLRSRGLKINELPCPMIIATNICKIPGFYGGYKYPKFQEAWDFMFPKNHYVEQHRGLDDALHEAKFVYELYKNGDFVIQHNDEVKK